MIRWKWIMLLCPPPSTVNRAAMSVSTEWNRSRWKSLKTGLEVAANQVLKAFTDLLFVFPMFMQVLLQKMLKVLNKKNK